VVKAWTPWAILTVAGDRGISVKDHVLNCRVTYWSPSMAASAVRVAPAVPEPRTEPASPNGASSPLWHRIPGDHWDRDGFKVKEMAKT
jgi:hypothetical protein